MGARVKAAYGFIQRVDFLTLVIRPSHTANMFQPNSKSKSRSEPSISKLTPTIAEMDCNRATQE